LDLASQFFHSNKLNMGGNKNKKQVEDEFKLSKKDAKKVKKLEAQIPYYEGKHEIWESSRTLFSTQKIWPPFWVVLGIRFSCHRTQSIFYTFNFHRGGQSTAESPALVPNFTDTRMFSVSMRYFNSQII